MKVTNSEYSKFVLSGMNNLYVYGSNTFGNLGLGPNKHIVYELTKVDISDVKDISCGNCHTLILKKDGTVYSVGINSFGQLGLGDTDSRYTFTKVDIDNVKKIMCSDDTTVFLKNDGTVYYCGYRWNCLSMHRYTPKRLKIKHKVRDISVSKYGTFMITENDDLYVCGDNIVHGQLGKPMRQSISKPSKVFINNVSKVFTSNSTSFVLKNDNTLWCCGSNSFGQLGIKTYKKTLRKFTRVNIDNVKDVICNPGDTIIIKNDNSVLVSGIHNSNIDMKNRRFSDYTTNTFNISRLYDRL